VLFSFLLIVNVPVSVTKVGYEQQAFYFRDTEFSIQWVHSVEKEQWREFFQRRNDELLLTRTKFKTFGAGVPAAGTIIKKEKGYVTYEVNRPMKEVNLVVSDLVQSTLTIADKSMPLYELVEDYEEVTITPTKRPWWMTWFSVH
jgi:hypothetical protein